MLSALALSVSILSILVVSDTIITRKVLCRHVRIVHPRANLILPLDGSFIFFSAKSTDIHRIQCILTQTSLKKGVSPGVSRAYRYKLAFSHLSIFLE